LDSWIPSSCEPNDGALLKIACGLWWNLQEIKQDSSYGSEMNSHSTSLELFNHVSFCSGGLKKARKTPMMEFLIGKKFGGHIKGYYICIYIQGPSSRLDWWRTSSKISSAGSHTEHWWRCSKNFAKTFETNIVTLVAIQTALKVVVLYKKLYLLYVSLSLYTLRLPRTLSCDLAIEASELRCELQTEFFVRCWRWMRLLSKSAKFERIHCDLLLRLQVMRRKWRLLWFCVL
jgi:hypothetical protein